MRYEIKEPENTYRNVSNVSLDISNMRGKGYTMNKGPGFFNKSVTPIRGCHDDSCSSDEDYHGRRHGYGKRLDERAYDISDLYHH